MKIHIALGMLFSGLLVADPGPGYRKLAVNKLFNGDTINEFELDNGLSVIHVPRSQAKVLTFQIWFDVGSNSEKLDPKLKKTGIAHLFEHMMFRGTDRFPDGSFDEISSRLGATSQNATTSFYRTNYFESIPSNQLEVVLALESDRMANLKLTQEGLEKEKGAVVGELRRALDSPVNEAYNALMELAYQKIPFRWTVLGTEKEIKGFTLEEAQYFYKTYYAPNNGTIVVVGDVEEEPLLNLLIKYFGQMKPQTIPSYSLPPEPLQARERTKVFSHPQATSEILLMGYKIPPISSLSVIPLGILSAHLSSGMEGRLRKLLIDTGVAVNAYASPSYRPDLFQIFVQLAEGHKAKEAIQIIDQEVKSLSEKIISEEDFNRARNQEKLDLYGSIDKNNSLARWLGEFNALAGNYMRGFEIIEGYNILDRKEVMEAANDYLVRSRRSVVIVTPSPTAPQKGKGKK